MKLLRLIGCCLLLSTLVHAQSNYKPGYVVKSQGDTIKGFINYKEWNKNPRSIEFKNSLSVTQATKYYPIELKCFAVDDMAKYITYRGPISMDKNIFPDLSYGLDTTTRIDTVFLQQFYNGTPASLYIHQDFKKRLFVSDNNSEPIELKYYEYYAVNGNSVLKYRFYAEKLSQLAQKYTPSNTQLGNNINTSRYDEGEIQKILKTINHDGSTKVVRGTYGSRFFIGLMLNQVSTGIDGLHTFSGKRSVGYYPRVNFGIDLMTNKFTQRAYFRVELGLSMVSPEFNTPYSQNDGYFFHYKQYTSSFTPQLLYNVYNKENFKLHIGGGAGINYSIYSNNESGYTTSTSTYTNKNTTDFTAIMINFPVQVGITVQKKYQILAYYAARESLTQYVNFSVSNRYCGLGINYLFGN